MIRKKTSAEIKLMREGGHLLADIIAKIGQAIIPGENTEKLDQLAEELIRKQGGDPIFKGQGGPENPFPATICASINEEIVHGIPQKNKIIQTGDLVKIDIGMRYKGMVTDMARTFPVGEISLVAKKLIKATQEGLNLGIKTIKDGAKLNDYSKAVESYVKSLGFSVVRDLVGHGVGYELHEDPQIPNYQTKTKEIIFQEGMTVALEPMINEGTFKIDFLNDGWTIVTQDGKLSAHFEDTVVVKKRGVEILTRN